MGQNKILSTAIHKAHIIKSLTITHSPHNNVPLTHTIYNIEQLSLSKWQKPIGSVLPYIVRCKELTT